MYKIKGPYWYMVPSVRDPSLSAQMGISLDGGVKLLRHGPRVQDLAEDVVEGDLRVRPSQAHEHEPLPVVEEAHVASVSFFDVAPPCFRPCSAR